MAKEFKLRIYTPEKQFFYGDVESLVLRATDGEQGVMAGHEPMITALEAAPMRIKQKGEWREAAIIGGFAEIRPAKVEIFADAAEWPEDIEEARALEAKRRAEERLHTSASELEYKRSRVALERALTRLNVKHGRLL